MHSPADGGCSCERRGCVAVGKHPRVSVRSETGLSHELGEAGNPPERIEATATVSFVPGEGVMSSHIVVQGRVPGIDQSGFGSAARNAGESCPISGALKGNVEITVEATLQS
jgi:organic hydroperoxide reductase OsmC/OhrA